MHDPIALRSARQAGGFTFKEVGNAARLDPSAVANYEAGRGRPSAAAAIRWQDGLIDLLGQRLDAIREALQTF